MNGRRYLQRCLDNIQWRSDKIKRMEEARLELLDRATSTTTRLNPVRVQTSHRNDRLEGFVLDAVGMEEKINRTFWDLAMYQVEVAERIFKTNRARDIYLLSKVYIQGKTVKRAAKEMNLGYKTALQHLNQAHIRFEQMNPDLFGKASGEQFPTNAD